MVTTESSNNPGESAVASAEHSPKLTRRRYVKSKSPVAEHQPTIKYARNVGKMDTGQLYESMKKVIIPMDGDAGWE